MFLIYFIFEVRTKFNPLTDVLFSIFFSFILFSIFSVFSISLGRISKSFPINKGSLLVKTHNNVNGYFGGFYD